MTSGLFIIYVATAWLVGVITQAILRIDRDDPRGYLYILVYLAAVIPVIVFGLS